MIEHTDTVVPAVFFFAASDPFAFSTSLPPSTNTTTLKRVTPMAVSFLCFNAIIALCLVCAKNHTRSKKAVVVWRTSLELHDADVCTVGAEGGRGDKRSSRRRQKYSKMLSLYEMYCTCTCYLGRLWEIQDGLIWVYSQFNDPKLFLASLFFPLPSKSRPPWHGPALWFFFFFFWT